MFRCRCKCFKYLQNSSNSFSMFPHSMPIAAKSQPLQQNGSQVLLRAARFELRFAASSDQDRWPGPKHCQSRDVCQRGWQLSLASSMLLSCSFHHPNPKKEFLECVPSDMTCFGFCMFLSFEIWEVDLEREEVVRQGLSSRRTQTCGPLLRFSPPFCIFVMKSNSLVEFGIHTYREICMCCICHASAREMWFMCICIYVKCMCCICVCVMCLVCLM